MPRPSDRSVDPRAFLKAAVNELERGAKSDAFELLQNLSADAPPNLLFIEAGKARATADIINAMRDKIAEAFRFEDDNDEGE